jgi:hypothetical protein
MYGFPDLAILRSNTIPQILMIQGQHQGYSTASHHFTINYTNGLLLNIYIVHFMFLQCSRCSTCFCKQLIYSHIHKNDVPGVPLCFMEHYDPKPTAITRYKKVS